MKENEEVQSSHSSEEHKNNHISGIFTTRESAEMAYHTLHLRGYDKDRIHVMMSPEAHQKHFSTDKHSPNFDTHNLKTSPNDHNNAKEGAETGAAVGIGVGAMTGALLAMGTSLLIPGLGILIAGSFLAAIAGAGAGGVTGGLIGALVGTGMHEEHAKKYEKGIKDGHIVLGVQPLNEQDAIYIESEWKRHKGIHIHRV